MNNLLTGYAILTCTAKKEIENMLNDRTFPISIGNTRYFLYKFISLKKKVCGFPQFISLNLPYIKLITKTVRVINI
jgi:hypothetical protein